MQEPNVQVNYGAGPGPSDTLTVDQIPVGPSVAPVNPVQIPDEPFVNELPERATSDHVTPTNVPADEPVPDPLPVTDVSTAQPIAPVPPEAAQG